MIQAEIVAAIRRLINTLRPAMEGRGYDLKLVSDLPDLTLDFIPEVLSSTIIGILHQVERPADGREILVTMKQSNPSYLTIMLSIPTILGIDIAPYRRTLQTMDSEIFLSPGKHQNEGSQVLIEIPISNTAPYTPID